MRVTLNLEPEVEAQIEQLLSQDPSRSRAQLLNEAIRQGLDRLEGTAPSERPFRTRVHSAGTCYLPDVDNIAEVLAFAEGEDYK